MTNDDNSDIKATGTDPRLVFGGVSLMLLAILLCFLFVVPGLRAMSAHNDETATECRKHAAQEFRAEGQAFEELDEALNACEN